MNGVREPISVEVVVLALRVSHELDRLEVGPGNVKALEEEGTLFDALDNRVAVDICGLRGSRRPLALGASAVGHC